MRVFLAVTILALLAGPAYAQTQNVPKYGDADKPKSPTEIEAEKEAQRAYKRSLGNIPDQGPTDPWGNVRSAEEQDLPITRAVRGVGETISLCAVPRSRSQITEMPLKMPMKRTLWASTPGAIKAK